MNVKTQPASRIAAELAHSEEVRRVDTPKTGRAKIYTTNNGLRHSEIDLIRLFGWEISAVHIRFNLVSISRKDRPLDTGADRPEGGDA